MEEKREGIYARWSGRNKTKREFRIWKINVSEYLMILEREHGDKMSSSVENVLLVSSRTAKCGTTDNLTFVFNWLTVAFCFWVAEPSVTSFCPILFASICSTDKEKWKEKGKEGNVEKKFSRLFLLHFFFFLIRKHLRKRNS